MQYDDSSSQQINMQTDATLEMVFQLYISLCYIVQLMRNLEWVSRITCWHMSPSRDQNRQISKIHDGGLSLFWKWFLPCDAVCKHGLCCRMVSICHIHVLYPDSWRYHQTSFSAR